MLRPPVKRCAALSNCLAVFRRISWHSGHSFGWSKWVVEKNRLHPSGEYDISSKLVGFWCSILWWMHKKLFVFFRYSMLRWNMSTYNGSALPSQKRWKREKHGLSQGDAQGSLIRSMLDIQQRHREGISHSHYWQLPFIDDLPQNRHVPQFCEFLKGINEGHHLVVFLPGLDDLQSGKNSQTLDPFKSKVIISDTIWYHFYPFLETVLKSLDWWERWGKLSGNPVWSTKKWVVFIFLKTVAFSTKNHSQPRYHPSFGETGRLVPN